MSWPMITADELRAVKDPYIRDGVLIMQGCMTRVEALPELLRETRVEKEEREQAAAVIELLLKQTEDLKAKIKELEETQDRLQGFRGYPKSQLEAAFEEIKPAHNWKLPINKVIKKPNEEHVKLLDAACVFYTGSSISIAPMGKDRVRVKAAGYYNTIGA
jgi:hypothetical protein